MPIIERKNLQIATAVEWSIEENRKAAKEASNKHGRKAICIQRKLDDGILVGVLGDGRSGAVYAGASLVAAAFPDAVLSEEIGDDQVWLCASRDGIPLPGSDRICSGSEARVAVSELMSYYPNAVLLGTVSGAKASFCEILASADKEYIKAARMRPVSANWIKVGAIAGVVAGLGVIAIVSVNKMNLDEAKSIEAMKMAEMLKSNQQIEAERQAMLARHREQVEKMRMELARRTSLAAQVGVWMQAIGRLPLSFEGWRPQVADCTKTECIVSWQPDQGAVPSTASRMGGEVVSTTSSEIKIRIPLAEQEMVELPRIERAATDAFWMTVTSYGQFYGTPIIIDTAPAPVQVPPPPGAKDIPAETVGYKGKWSMSLAQDAYARLPVMISRLAGFPMSATSMKLNGLTGGQPVIQMEGDYVVF